MIRSKELWSVYILAVIFTVITTLLGSAGATAEIRLKTTTASLGRVPTTLISQTLTVSPDSRHIAFAFAKDQSVSVILNGRPLKRYSNIGMSAFKFSPDGKKLAYPVTRGPSWTISVNGVEGELYDGIGTTIAFSSDSQHMAYAARKGEKRVVVLDGKEQKGEYNAILEGTPILNRGGKHIAYGAGRGTKWLVVMNYQFQISSITRFQLTM